MKNFFAVVSTLCLFFISTQNVLAEESFNPFFTVDSNNSITEKNEFTLDETPWVFGHIDDVGSTRHAHFQALFYFDDEYIDVASANGKTGTADFWATPLSWDSIKQPGVWTVEGYFQIHNNVGNDDYKTGFNTYTFTVTPEPASMALFGLGAGALGLSRRLRRKKA